MTALARLLALRRGPREGDQGSSSAPPPSSPLGSVAGLSASSSDGLQDVGDLGLVPGRRRREESGPIRALDNQYRVEPRGMKPLIDWIAHYRAFWTEHVDRLERLLEKMDG